MLASLISMLLSAISPLIMEWIKGKPWLPLLQRNAPLWNRLVAIAIAVGQTIGISFAFDATTGTLVVSGLVIDQIVRMAVTALLAFITQEVVYRQLPQPVLASLRGDK